MVEELKQESDVEVIKRQFFGQLMHRDIINEAERVKGEWEPEEGDGSQEGDKKRDNGWIKENKGVEKELVWIALLWKC